MPHLATMEWNFVDQTLAAVSTSAAVGHAYCVPAVGGGRRPLREVIERRGNLELEMDHPAARHLIVRTAAAVMPMSCRFDTLDGMRQRHLHRKHCCSSQHQDPATTTTSNSTNPVGVALIRYQYTNRLGSAVLETRRGQGIRSRMEEYHPCGTAACRSATVSGCDTEPQSDSGSAGQERDEETGLCCFGARCFAPLGPGSWTGSDPAGHEQRS